MSTRLKNLLDQRIAAESQAAAPVDPLVESDSARQAREAREARMAEAEATGKAKHEQRLELVQAGDKFAEDLKEGRRVGGERKQG